MFGLSNLSLMFPARRFNENYRCFSVSVLNDERSDIGKGGKIIMPASALETLTRFHVEYPMLFKLTNLENQRSSHAGVLEFIADEGKCYLPYWMMCNLFLEEGDMINIENVSLPIATYSKFQPNSTDFLDITNPKAVLENALRNFACLTKGDIIAIQYNNKIYELNVLETKPGNAVSIIECDMNVEFEAPVGYKEPTSSKAGQEKQTNDVEPMQCEEIVETFAGAGVRLDGKAKKAHQTEMPTVVKKALPRGIPDYNYDRNAIIFDRSVLPISDRQNGKNNDESTELDEDGFRGQGFSLKTSK